MNKEKQVNDFIDSKGIGSGTNITVSMLKYLLLEFSSSQEIKLPTDEEIEEKYPERNSSGTYLDTNMGRREGAKQMRDLIKQQLTK